MLYNPMTTINMTRQQLRRPPHSLRIFCAIDVVKIDEDLLIKLEIKKDQPGIAARYSVCIGCLEQRLRRRLSIRDFYLPYDDPEAPSIRLLHRLFGDVISTRKPYRLCSWTKLHDHCGVVPSPAMVEAIGAYAASLSES